MTTVYVPPTPTKNEIFHTIPKGINFDKYDKIDVIMTGDGKLPKKINSFDAANLDPKLLTNIKKKFRFTKPTPVQKCALPVVAADRDLMACAQTGSGKTAAYLLPVLNGIMKFRSEITTDEDKCQSPLVLIIAPTRELVDQICKSAEGLCEGTDFRPTVIYGGVRVSYQRDRVKEGCSVLIATPGRLLHFLNESLIELSNLKYLVLDEADRMLDMGFIPDIRRVINENNISDSRTRRTLMFSATYPKEIQELATEFLDRHIFCTIGKVGISTSDITQVVEEILQMKKRERLMEILDEQGEDRNLVFITTKKSADFLANYLSQKGYPATSIHGDRFQEERERALKDFRDGTFPVLVATSVAARGLDITDVKQVINFDLPTNIEDYIHRIGRTGRIGNTGKAISFFVRGTDEALARGLVKVLANSEQVVPDWLEEVAERALATDYGPKSGKYGAKDVRQKRGGFTEESFNAMDDAFNTLSL